jgi:hypothetical protein
VKIDGEEFTYDDVNGAAMCPASSGAVLQLRQGRHGRHHAGRPAPSGQFTTVKNLDNYTISDDPANGANNDHDAVIEFSALDR